MDRVLVSISVGFVVVATAIFIHALNTADALRASCDPPQPIVIVAPNGDVERLADKAARCAQVLEGSQAVNDLCLKRLRVCLGVPP